MKHKYVVFELREDDGYGGQGLHKGYVTNKAAGEEWANVDPVWRKYREFVLVAYDTIEDLEKENNEKLIEKLRNSLSDKEKETINWMFSVKGETF